MPAPQIRPYDLFEIKAATFLIGLTQVALGLSTFGHIDSLFVQAMRASSVSSWWAALLLGGGLWTFVASLMPNRSQRHHALIASWAVLWATFGMFLFWGLFTMPVALLWAHGTAALVTFLVDVYAFDRARRRAGTSRGAVPG